MSQFDSFDSARVKSPHARVLTKAGLDSLHWSQHRWDRPCEIVDVNGSWWVLPYPEQPGLVQMQTQAQIQMSVGSGSTMQSQTSARGTESLSLRLLFVRGSFACILRPLSEVPEQIA
jgi:hypothetical protein